MTDIVEQLRDGYPCGANRCQIRDTKSCFCAEAADEIERLRMRMLDATTMSEARQLEIERLRSGIMLGTPADVDQLKWAMAEIERFRAELQLYKKP